MDSYDRPSHSNHCSPGSDARLFCVAFRLFLEWNCSTVLFWCIQALSSFKWSCLEFTEILESIHLCLLSNVGSSHPLFLQEFFMLHVFSSPFGTLMTQNLDLLALVYGLQALFTFLQWFLSLLFRIIFIDLIF